MPTTNQPDKEHRSPCAAIREKCLDCCSRMFREVRRCPITNCPLYPYRFGHNPARKGVGRPKKEKKDE